MEQAISEGSDPTNFVFEFNYEKPCGKGCGWNPAKKQKKYFSVQGAIVHASDASADWALLEIMEEITSKHVWYMGWDALPNLLSDANLPTSIGNSAAWSSQFFAENEGNESSNETAYGVWCIFYFCSFTIASNISPLAYGCSIHLNIQAMVHHPFLDVKSVSTVAELKHGHCALETSLGCVKYNTVHITARDWTSGWVEPGSR
mgnify:FL=1